MFVETGARRMNNPEDRLIKLASTLFGKVLHGYLKLPGNIWEDVPMNTPLMKKMPEPMSAMWLYSGMCPNTLILKMKAPE